VAHPIVVAEAMTIRVYYPLEQGRLVLRTDRDWEESVAPVAEGADGRTFDFHVELDQPFRYFKPVLLRDGTAHWSQGENYLALAGGSRRVDVYPHFFEDSSCSVCDLRVLPSRRLARQHALRVFLPPGYEENRLASYPVLFMQDGQNLFFQGEAFNGHPWKVEETARILDRMNLIRRVIVVGVYPHDRETDYTRPGYEAYGRYLVEEVKPWVDANYRTLRGPEHVAVMGSSLGGVVSLYLGWEWPQVFGRVACLSSTFGWRDDLLQRVRRENRRPIRIYLDSGWPQDNYEVTRSMCNLLRTRGYRDGQDLFYLAFPGAAHNEEAWAMRAHVPFQWFFTADGRG
jgi:predicted alpha/beta superfamily hydrolase